MQERFVSFARKGKSGFGLWRADGIVDLSEKYPSLLEVIKAGALSSLAIETKSARVNFAESEITFEIPLANPEKIICVGVNFPDRNAEYKDGQEAPPNPSLFIRFPRSFVKEEILLVLPSFLLSTPLTMSLPSSSRVTMRYSGWRREAWSEETKCADSASLSFLPE